LWESEGVAASSTRATSLTAARLLPRQVRAARRRERTAFLIEDLNGAYFTLAGRRRAAGRSEVAAARVRRLLVGTRWMSNVAADAWAYAEAMDAPEEAFGPAAVLLTVASAEPRVRRWVASLSTDVQHALVRVFGADVISSSAPRAPAPRPRGGARGRPADRR
jgi:hypothetical protein